MRTFEFKPEIQSFTGTSCSWENVTFESDDDGSQDLESSVWSCRPRFEYPQSTGHIKGLNGLPQSRSPNRSLHGQRKRKRSGSVDFSESGPKRSMTADAFQSISSWKYTELVQDNLTLALVDENDDDGCLLRETWPEIEGRLADMVAKRLRAVPEGPNPLFDSSYVIRGHRVIRCLDGYSKIFLEDCMDKIGNTWRGLRIRLVHASEIPCPEARRILPSTEDVEQTEENSFGWTVPRGAQMSKTAILEIRNRALSKRKRLQIPTAEETNQTEEVNQTEEAEQTHEEQQTVKNSFGWIVPRGAQISDTAIQEIQIRKINNPKGQQNRFMLKDGPTIWRVFINRNHEVHILEHIPLAGEVDHMEKMNLAEDLNQLEGVEQMRQVDEISYTELTEVNSLGWIVPPGAQFSDTAIQHINNFMIRAKGRRMAYLLSDGLKAWRVLVSRGDRVRIRPYTGSAVRKEPSNKIEAIDQSEQRENIEQTMLIDEADDTELTDGTKQTKELIQPAEINHKEEISQANETELTEVNSLGWTVPRGAQFSDTAIQQINNFMIKAKGKRTAFLVFDGLKAWRMLVSRGGQVRIRPYTRSAVRKEQMEEIEHTEDRDQKEVDKSLVINPTEPTKDTKLTENMAFSEDNQILISHFDRPAVKTEPSEQKGAIEVNGEELKQTEKANLEDGMDQTMETVQPVVNSLGWILVDGAQPSETAILQIQPRVLKRTNKTRYRFLVKDGLKTWRVYLHGSHPVRVGPYNPPVDKTKEMKPTEDI
ncbi:hypothetical protein KR084_007398 [Drosophila pseudotakahashii]|nr:hypothetical protein KR084_007398 [Drosophila pseudotakahashii]